MKESTLKRSKMYECSFLTLYEDDVKLESGMKSKRVVIKHPGGACVLPITKDGKVILTKQFRYPINQVSIEIPAGKKDDALENSLTCAKRELEEETSYQSDHYEHIFTLHPCVGYSDEKLDIFLAIDCYKVEQPRPMDEDEDIDVMIVDRLEIKNLLKNGSITDGKTIIALQYYLAM